MKKLMFIAAAALVFCANAAICNWDVDTVYNPSTGDTSTGFLVYYFDADTAGTSVSDANTALASKNAATINAFLANGYAADDVTDDGSTGGFTPDIYGNGATVNAYLVIFNADSVASADYAFVSGIESGATGGLGQSANISFGDLDDTATLANWTKISSGGIPEPTSGLLLLVGGAMLALRRKRG